MLTLFLWCIINGFIFHYNASEFIPDTKVIIIVICLASDLNLLFCSDKHDNKKR